MLAAKEDADHLLLTSNRQLWYQVNPILLEPDSLATYYPSHYDQDTEDFISTSVVTSNSLCLQLYYSAVSAMLAIIVTKTSINGLLGRGGMYISAGNSLRHFLALSDEWSPVGRRVLDLGAGDGSVTTAAFGPLYMHISCTDASKVMEWRLAQRGFQVLPVDKWVNTGRYDLISALNLLDRHYDPMGLFDQLHQLASESNCMVLLSLVLPMRPFVEFPQQIGGAPESKELRVRGVKFEEQVNSLLKDTFLPAGFEVVRWTKLPYLCEGDLAQVY
jgi:hypothetical protein